MKKYFILAQIAIPDFNSGGLISYYFSYFSLLNDKQLLKKLWKTGDWLHIEKPICSTTRLEIKLATREEYLLLFHMNWLINGYTY